MKKLVGYVMAIGGLAAMAVGFGAFGIDASKFSSLGSSTISIIGIVLVVVGVFFTLRADKGRSSNDFEEVPIYEGTGKHRKIVGYQRR